MSPLKPLEIHVCLFLQVLSSGVESFLNDYTVPVNITDKTSSKQATPLCESCDSKGTATAYCCDCPAHLCESCVTSHQAFKFLRGHNIEDIKSEKVNKLSPKNKAVYCSLHPDKKYELYCKSCQCVTCLMCFVNSHNGHDIGDIDSDTRIQVQTQIKDLMGRVEAKVTEFEEDLTYVKEIEEDTTKESNSLKEEINKSFDSLVAAIEARRAALVEEVEAASVKDLKEIWAQKEVVETSITASRGALALATRSLQCTNDLELLLLGAQVNKQLQELSGKSWDPTSMVEIEMTLREYTKCTPLTTSKLGQIKVSIIPMSESEPLSVSTETTTPQLGVPITLSIAGSRKNKRNRNTMLKLQLQPSVRVLHGNKKVDIPHPPSIVADKKGTWLATFTPVVSGNHVIIVEAKLENSGTVKTESTITVTGEPSIGDRVQRGPDWDYSYSNQDGGQGNEGTISSIQTASSFKLYVSWDKGQRFNYRWDNKLGVYDLQLVLSTL